MFTRISVVREVVDLLITLTRALCCVHRHGNITLYLTHSDNYLSFGSKIELEETSWRTARPETLLPFTWTVELTCFYL